MHLHLSYARNGAGWLCAVVLSLAACSKTDRAAGPSASASAGVQPLTTDWAKPRSSLLAVGDEAPDFDALAHTGHRVRLSQFLDRPIIVYFYPQDATPGCTTEAQQIRDAWLRLQEKVSMVFGVSGDSNVSHREFATEHGLPFLLVTDPDFRLSKAFGVPVENGRVSRVTFIIGKDRKVLRVFSRVNPDGHASELLAALNELGKTE